MAGSGEGAHDSVTACAGAAPSVPHIAQLSVSHNSRMHIGPQFVALTQNVHQDRVVKGNVLGLALAAREGSRRGRCIAAVCVCWALVVATALAALAAHLALAQRTLPLDLELHEPWYLRRADWQAMPAFERDPAAQAHVALVGHSAGATCDDRYECTELALNMQRDHQRHGWADIGPNFLVGGGRAGLVLEGRGAGVIGAMVRGWNARSVSVMFAGDFRLNHDTPSPAAIEHLQALLSALVVAGALHPSYVLLGHCQVAPWNYTPGVRLLRELSRLPHWDERNVSSCLEWSR